MTIKTITRNAIILAVSITAFVTSLVGIYINLRSHKFAYVRTAELVYGYNGMREARANYKNQTEAWQANVDSLRVQYQRCLNEYQSNYKSLQPKEREEKQLLIRKLEENYKNYSTVIKQQAKEKEIELTGSVINQINSYVEEYARKKGYDFVIGSSNGTLIYGNKEFDITDEVLAAINKEYSIMPTSPSKKLP